MTIASITPNNPVAGLLKLTVDLHTFIYYLNYRRNRQLHDGLLNDAAITEETLDFMKDLYDDLWKTYEDLSATTA